MDRASQSESRTGYSEFGTGWVDRASLELDGWIKRVWNWTGRLSE